ncbi:MAG: DUF2974 domain-containing protein [Erysipelotrichaceae bacterium]|nr:DUF2974 domain-containing protein [Erysipelotrichaceae bacterium]
MSNILDYVDWRGDLSYQVAPFNDIDNLIYTQLSYALWDGILSSSFDEEVTLSDAVEEFFRSERDRLQQEDGFFSSDDMLKLMRAIQHAERYKNNKLFGYVSQIDVPSAKQFSAMCFALEDDTVYVAYRGTDNTMVGWREDFNLSFMYTIPSQHLALNYLHDVAIHREKTMLRVGGHSKGGNLAIYAGSFLPMALQGRIITIYNNDGPGLMKELTESAGYQRIVSKVRTFVPQSSVIGMILELVDDYQIVHSNTVSLFQHDAFSWEVKGTSFVYDQKLHGSSLTLNKAFNEWVSNLSYEDKSRFFNIIFDMLEEAGIQTTSQMRKESFKTGYALIKKYNTLSDEEKKLLGDGFGYFLKIIAGDTWDKLPIPFGKDKTEK